MEFMTGILFFPSLYLLHIFAPMFLLFKGLVSHYIVQLVCDKLSTLLANTSILGRGNNGGRIASESLTKAPRERNNKDVITEIVCVPKMQIECFLKQMGNQL
jgi:hypothetical protein